MANQHGFLDIRHKLRNALQEWKHSGLLDARFAKIVILNELDLFHFL